MNFNKKIRTNLISGLTVALVSIPLSISLAVASLVSPIQGIITAIWAGSAAAFFGSSNFNIIGPTGALSGIIATFALIRGIEAVSSLAVLAGLFILVSWAFGIERFIIFVPSSALHGFILGVACIIVFNQLNFALGLQNMAKHSEFIYNIWDSLQHLKDYNPAAVFVFALFLSGLFLIKKIFPRLSSIMLLAPFGILLGYSSLINLETLGSKFGQLNFQLFNLPTLMFSWNLIGSAFTVALIAILEVILSAKIADACTKTKHKSSRELLGLGLANIIAGLAGGIPVTASLAPTMLNIRTGATSKLSGIINGIAIAIISMFCLSYFSYMPMPVIAAILIYVAINMIEREHFGRMFAYDKVNFFISLLVALLTVIKDPIVGILVGSSISLLIFMNKLAYGHYEVMIESPEKETSHPDVEEYENIYVYYFKGKLTYINSQAHIARFEDEFTTYKNIILNLTEVFFIDIDGCDAIDEIIFLLHKQNKHVVIVTSDPHITHLLKAVSKQFVRLDNQGSIFKKMSDALSHIKNLIP